MKKKKILFALLVGIFLINVTTVNAKRGIIVDHELVRNKELITGEWQKDTFSIQEYENTSSITVLTNPCPDCKILVRVWNSDKDWSSARITKMGHTYDIGRTTHAVPGKHKLKLQRSDTTLLNTAHVATWYID